MLAVTITIITRNDGAGDYHLAIVHRHEGDDHPTHVIEYNDRPLDRVLEAMARRVRSGEFH